MKKILIYEYFTGGGMLNEELSGEIIHEAELIRSMIHMHGIKSKLFTTKYFIDHRISSESTHDNIVVKDSTTKYDRKLLKEFDFILPIIPEENLELFNYIKYLENNKIKCLTSNSTTIKLCSDKLYLYHYLSKNNIATPSTYEKNIIATKKNKYIVKDRYGYGCSHVELFTNKNISKPLLSNKVYQDYIEGKSYSLSLYFSKNNFKLLSINEQKFIIKKSKYKLSTLIVNIKHNHYVRIIALIANLNRLLPGLFGYIGIDLIISGNQIYVIEINPRLTTSFAAIYRTFGINLLDLIVENKYMKNIITGKKVHLNINA